MGENFLVYLSTMLLGGGGGWMGENFLVYLSTMLLCGGGGAGWVRISWCTYPRCCFVGRGGAGWVIISWCTYPRCCFVGDWVGETFMVFHRGWLRLLWCTYPRCFFAVKRCVGFEGWRKTDWPRDTGVLGLSLPHAAPHRLALSTRPFPRYPFAPAYFGSRFQKTFLLLPFLPCGAELC